MNIEPISNIDNCIKSINEGEKPNVAKSFWKILSRNLINGYNNLHKEGYLSIKCNLQQDMQNSQIQKNINLEQQIEDDKLMEYILKELGPLSEEVKNNELTTQQQNTNVEIMQCENNEEEMEL